MPKKKILICGITGFIGRNILEHLLRKAEYDIYGTYFRTPLPASLLNATSAHLIKVDLTDKAQVDRIIKGVDIVIQAAATTSGAKDIVTKPYYHVTDNAVMNSLIFRSCFEHRVNHVVFFSCTTMYTEQPEPVKETDFHHEIIDKYFGVGWTKVYIEKMCEFYARISPAKYTAIRHSNIYGPYDKYDLERSHVFGATVAKVMNAHGGKLVVWGDGSDERDLLYVDDLVSFVDLAISKQTTPFELLNVGFGISISVRDLVEKIIRHAGKSLKVEYDRSKPSINFKLAINIDQAKKVFGWAPRTTLDEGIKKSLAWYQKYYLETQPV